jgi:hypothetical protein
VDYVEKDALVEEREKKEKTKAAAGASGGAFDLSEYGGMV